MKTIKYMLLALFSYFVLSVTAQNMVEAGPNQTIYCSGAVQLNATPMTGWALIQQQVLTNSINSINFPTPEIGYATSGTGVVGKTTDGGNTWSIQTLGGSTFYCVQFVSPTKGWIGGSGGMLMRTYDGGVLWKPVYLGLTSLTIRSIFFASELVGYAVGSGGYVLKTIDGGNTWTNKVVASNLTFYSVCFTTPTKGFIVSTLGTIYSTVDGGDTWTLQNSGLTTTLNSVSFVNNNTGFIVGNGGTILKTTDGGTTWNKYSADSIYTRYETGEVIKSSGRLLRTAVFYSVNVINDSVLYAVGTYSSKGIIAKSTDTGKTWYEMPVSGGTKFMCASFTSQGGGYAGGNLGAIYKYNSNNNNAGLTYRWYPTDGLSNASIANPVASPLNTTKYTVTASNGSNVYTDSLTVAVSPLALTVNPYANIGCEGSVRLDSISVLYTGNERLRYKWQPSTGLSCDTILHPVATVDVETNYLLSAYTSTCSANASVTVLVRGLSVAASVNKTIVGTGTAQLNTKTNYTGTSRLSYKWSPSTGLSSDTIPNPVVSMSCLSGTVQRNYIVDVRSATGCNSQGIVTVSATAFSASAGAAKNVMCGASVQLSATSNYNGPGTLRYKWSPSTGLSNDTIANPVATVNTTTYYNLVLTTPTGNTTSCQSIVNVAPVTINAGNDTTVVCGGKVPLVGFSTNYNGSGTLRYKWRPAIGLSNDTIVSPFASPTVSTTYKLTVTTPAGCTAIDSVKVTVNPVIVNAGADVSGSCGTQIQMGPVTTNYSGTGPLKYKWTPNIGISNDTIANPLITIGTNKTYTVTVTTPSGCVAYDVVNVVSSQLTKPTIRYVGVNTNNKNELNWTIPMAVSPKVIIFNVYKETNVTDNYVKIGAIAATSANATIPVTFVDTLSHPDVQSNKYKLTVLDDCGLESSTSDYHKTMHLTINKGQGSIWNLIWEPYEGYAVSTYNIYRGTSASNIQIIGSLSGSNTQFSDYTAPAGYVYYQVEAVSSVASGVRQLAKSTSEVAYFSSRSNIATNKSGPDGLYNLKDISDRFTVTPNPASTMVKLQIDDNAANNMQLNVYNAVGQLVKVEQHVSNAQFIDISSLSSGLYMLVVKSENFSGMHKLLIQK